MNTLGYGPCPVCGNEGLPVKANKKGHLYVYCTTPADGGCGSGTQSRSTAGDTKIAHTITKWNDTEERKKWLGDESLPKKAREPAPAPKKPEPEPEPTPAPAPAPKKPWYEMEL